MEETDSPDERILAYLRDKAAGGDRYFRAKHIADAIGLTAKQVGARLPRSEDAHLILAFAVDGADHRRLASVIQSESI